MQRRRVQWVTRHISPVRKLLSLSHSLPLRPILAISGVVHLHLMVLGLVAKEMVHQHYCQHGFSDRHSPDPDARVVPAFGQHLYWLTTGVDTTPRNTDTGGWFERNTDLNILA